jgi:hypothetical protein
MAKNKTVETNKNVMDFIQSFAETEQKRNDSYTLLKLMQTVPGFGQKIWGPGIIGFGNYHYIYANRHLCNQYKNN